VNELRGMEPDNRIAESDTVMGVLKVQMRKRSGLRGRSSKTRTRIGTIIHHNDTVSYL
jgi:hypothetical protein